MATPVVDPKAAFDQAVADAQSTHAVANRASLAQAMVRAQAQLTALNQTIAAITAASVGDLSAANDGLVAALVKRVPA